VFGSSVKYTWENTHSRCLKLASALVQLGISRGDVVKYYFLSFNVRNVFNASNSYIMHNFCR